MKQLQITPPLLIITMGYPGSGKTFFARQFAEHYSLPRVSEDRIRFELFEQPRFVEEEAEIIGRIQQYTLEEMIQTRQIIICEGLFLQVKQRRDLIDFAYKNGYRVLTVWLQTDFATCAARATQRDKRSIDNKYSFALSMETLNSFKNTLQRPDEKEASVVISGKHAFKSQCLTVLRKITAMYSDDITQPVAPPVAQTRRATMSPRKPGTRHIIQ